MSQFHACSTHSDLSCESVSCPPKNVPSLGDNSNIYSFDILTHFGCYFIGCQRQCPGTQQGLY